MPNHVTTIIRAPKDVLDFLRSEESQVDFNRLVPMPRELRLLTAEYRIFDTQEEVDEHNAEQQRRGAKMPEIFRPRADAIFAITTAQHEEWVAQFGPGLDWYSWNSTHWGTKWNAYDVDRRADDTVKFDTAWAHPAGLMGILSEKFPSATIEVAYADEDFGYNLGEYTLREGDLVLGDAYTSEQEGTVEAYELAARVKYDQTLEEWAAESRSEYEEYGETWPYSEKVAEHIARKSVNS